MPPKKLLMVTRQAGSVAAFEPLIQPLQTQDWKCDILAFDNSEKEWRKSGYNLASKRIGNLNDKLPYNLLLTGTSSYVKEDAYFWDLAIKNAVPSIAFVDSWVNYSKRFTVLNKFDKTPDYIGLIDQFMYERMTESGAPVHKLVVLGHPRFDTALRKYLKYQEKVVDNSIFTIVFFTYTVSSDGSADVIGYNTDEVVSFVLNQLSIHSETSRNKVKLIFKPHPRENVLSYQELTAGMDHEFFNAMVSDEDPYTLMSEADVVIGLNTILLVDSSKMGIPTFSFQPGRKIRRNDITDRMNIHVITSWDNITEVISDNFHSFKKKDPDTSDNENTDRFVQYINRLAI